MGVVFLWTSLYPTFWSRQSMKVCLTFLFWCLPLRTPYINTSMSGTSISWFNSKWMQVNGSLSKWYLTNILLYNLKRSHEIKIRLACIRIKLDFKNAISCLVNLLYHLFLEFWVSSLANSKGLYKIHIW